VGEEVAKGEALALGPGLRFPCRGGPPCEILVRRRAQMLYRRPRVPSHLADTGTDLEAVVVLALHSPRAGLHQRFDHRQRGRRG
jgi:hypothetical protein